MFNPPLAPHEIDQLPIAERVRATIEEAEEIVELSFQDELDRAIESATDLSRAVDDLYSELNDLIDAIENEDPDELERAVKFAKLAIERNTP